MTIKLTQEEIALIGKLTETAHPALKRLAQAIQDEIQDEDEGKPKPPKHNRSYSRMHHRHNRS